MAELDDKRIGILAVWNPLILPETIAAHVKALEASPADDRHCWWGRIYRGDAPGSADKWHWTEHLDGGAERVVLVTSHQALHALRIDGIVKGELPPAERAHVPDYYGTQSAVALWFRVRDIRSVSWSQLKTIQTVQDLSEVSYAGGGRWAVDSAWPVDVYAARKYDWPILVNAGPVEEWFEGGTDWWRRPETEAPDDVREEEERLSGELAFWDQLSKGSQLSLATAEAVQRQLAGARGGAFDAASVAIGWTRAAEVELCRRLCQERVFPFAKPLAKSLSDGPQTRELLPYLDPSSRREPTLGTAGVALQLLADLLDSGKVETKTLGARQADIARVARLRNDAAHGRVVTVPDLGMLRTALTGDDGLLPAALRAQQEFN